MNFHNIENRFTHEEYCFTNIFAGLQNGLSYLRRFPFQKIFPLNLRIILKDEQLQWAWCGLSAKEGCVGFIPLNCIPVWPGKIYVVSLWEIHFSLFMMPKLPHLLRYSTLSSYIVLVFSTDSMGEEPAYQGTFPSFRVPKDMCSVEHSRIFPSSSCEAVSIQLRLIGNSYVHAILGVML